MRVNPCKQLVGESELLLAARWVPASAQPPASNLVHEGKFLLACKYLLAF